MISGHVIEHSQDTQLYIKECMRVLKDGGILFLEFPNRYHWKELHTGLFSFEWLPHKFRNAIIRLISSKYSPLNSSVKQRYESILSTGLQQISLTGIQRMLRKSRVGYELLNPILAAPGIIRCVIRKNSV